MSYQHKNTVYCNLCGSSIGEEAAGGGFSVHKKIGFGSIHDGDDLKLTVCPRCLDRIVSKCAINPVDRKG